MKIDQSNKAKLERILTDQLFREDPGPFVKVTISDDGQFAVLQVAEKYATRKLSKYGKRFLRAGSAVLVTGESFYEPKEPE